MLCFSEHFEFDVFKIFDTTKQMSTNRKSGSSKPLAACMMSLHHLLKQFEKCQGIPIENIVAIAYGSVHVNQNAG